VYLFSAGNDVGEHSPFVPVTIDVVIGWLFEDGYAKEAARYFQTAGNSFRTMLKKSSYRCTLKYQDKRGMLSFVFAAFTFPCNMDNTGSHPKP